MSDTQKTDQDIATEIQTLSGFIDELNYYEMFCLSPDCIQSDIPIAYKSMVDRFTPSQLTAPSEGVTEQGNYLILSFKEAFETLNSIASRLQYDVLLSNGQIRIDDTQLALEPKQQRYQQCRNDRKWQEILMLARGFRKQRFHSALASWICLQYESSNETSRV